MDASFNEKVLYGLRFRSEWLLIFKIKNKRFKS